MDVCFCVLWSGDVFHLLSSTHRIIGTTTERVCSVASEWLTPAFTLGGVFIGSGGTVLGNWLSAKRQSSDKKVEFDYALREVTRNDVLAEIAKFIIAADDWLGSLKRFEIAAKTAWDNRLEQQAHDATLKEAYQAPQGWDIGELEAHTPTVDREFHEAYERVDQAATDLRTHAEVLENTSPRCEIIAPSVVANHVEEFTLQALTLTDHLRMTDWLQVIEQEGVPVQKFTDLRKKVTVSTRDWNHPKRK